MIPSQTDVLVVGAGPTGLAAACALRQGGVDVAIVDRAAEGANTSRAAVLHARTLEVLETVDVTDRLLAEGVVVPVFTVRDRTRVLARIDFTGLPTNHPYTVMLPQSRTESLLLARLTELGGEVHRPCAVLDATPAADFVEVRVERPSGEQQRIRARYVIGADGMNSRVRETVGIGYTGGRYAQSFVLADIVMDWPLPTGEVQLFFSPAGLVVVAPLPQGRHRVVATMDDAPEVITAAHVQALLDERGPGGATVGSLVWGSRFRVHHRVADRYREGGIFLAGDAAHVHSPAGGQGMNTGIQDAVALSAILARALSGDAHDGELEAELDSYQLDRRPVAERVVALTDRATRMATLTSPMARAARNTGMRFLTRIPAAQRRLALELAELHDRRTFERPGTPTTGAPAAQ